MNTKYIYLIVFLLAFLQEVYAQTKCNQGQRDLNKYAWELKCYLFFCTEVRSECYLSSDPNEIVVLKDYNVLENIDTIYWVSATQTLAYTIYFENDAELAMAAARKVSVTVPLHEKLNFATFKEDKQP